MHSRSCGRSPSLTPPPPLPPPGARSAAIRQYMNESGEPDKKLDKLVANHYPSILNLEKKLVPSSFDSRRLSSVLHHLDCDLSMLSPYAGVASSTAPTRGATIVSSIVRRPARGPALSATELRRTARPRRTSATTGSRRPKPRGLSDRRGCQSSGETTLSRTRRCFSSAR